MTKKRKLGGGQTLSSPLVPRGIKSRQADVLASLAWRCQIEANGQTTTSSHQAEK